MALRPSVSWHCPVWQNANSTISIASSQISKRRAASDLRPSAAVGGNYPQHHCTARTRRRAPTRSPGLSVLSHHHDITNRRRVAAELRRQGELLQAANKEKPCYSVSHDLRAPLRHIDGYAALLSKAAGRLDEKAQRYLQTISDSAKQMGQLIDDLLVFSRMGRQEMLRTTVNLNQLIKAVIQDLRLDLQGRTISWRIGTLPDVPGDPAMLRQVFMNLLTNALKFTATRQNAQIEIGAKRMSLAK